MGRWMGALFVLSMAPPTCCQVRAASAWQMLKHSMEKKTFPRRSEYGFNTAECCSTRAGTTTDRRHVKAALSGRLKPKPLSFKFHIWKALFLPFLLTSSSLPPETRSRRRHTMKKSRSSRLPSLYKDIQ